MSVETKCVFGLRKTRMIGLLMGEKSDNTDGPDKVSSYTFPLSTVKVVESRGTRFLHLSFNTTVLHSSGSLH